MTVNELIKLLQRFNGDLPIKVVFQDSLNKAGHLITTYVIDDVGSIVDPPRRLPSGKEMLGDYIVQIIADESSKREAVHGTYERYQSDDPSLRKQPSSAE